ncbi:MAG: fructose-1,6-bisphosphatase [Oscillospiraceae bacterium]|jgi:fructose-1,6-bisphosphatase-3
MNEHYKQLLAREYPNAISVLAEIVNLKAILSLPKGTEYFFSDLHGEHSSFLHMLNSASGSIRAKIDERFGDTLNEEQREDLAALIYRPEVSLRKLEQKGDLGEEWYRTTISHLSEICRIVSSKYTRSKVRKKLPPDFAYIIEELLYEDGSDNRAEYHEAVIRSMVETGMADILIIGICTAIRRLSVDMLHIIGDIYDRGPRPDAILNELLKLPDIDVQWGNHDITWMGAASGSQVLIATVLRIGISYNNFDLLEAAYGINLRPLATFAATVYGDDPCEHFQLHVLDKNKHNSINLALGAKMHKAIAVIQFKLEGQLIAKRPEFGMHHRDLLHKIDFKTGEITLQGITYPLRDTNFPTVSPEDPLTLTQEESALMEILTGSFLHSEPLNRHIRFLYSSGSMYKRFNSNLLYHGCIPMTEEGTLDAFCLYGKTYRGRAWLDYIDTQMRLAYFGEADSPERQFAQDFVWYLWCGSKSPLFGKDQMTTFERYFIEDKKTHKEYMNPYYTSIAHREACEMILREFDLDPSKSHIINGHVPVKWKDGEHPRKGDGLLYIIDGGMSKAYQRTTGIGGYTLIFNSRHLALAAHKPHSPCAVGPRPSPTLEIVEKMEPRMRVADTDIGKTLAARVEELKWLLAAYRRGEMTERHK